MKKVLLNGANGKMGQALARLMKERPELGLFPAVLRSRGQEIQEDFDLVIDFSTPEGAQEAFALAKHRKKPFLTGTTNLSDLFLFQMQETTKIPVFYAPNVSLSVYFFTELVRQAEAMYRGYEIALHEIHHVHKKDAPSGTAKRLADVLDLPHEKVTYERTGEVVGTHIATFKGPMDTITLSHEATNRDLFAQSALEIAAWLVKMPGGFYTMKNFANFKLKERKK
ncbi:MAG: hypothetical protein J5601_06925 [Elusimicrobiaceae bacterium]|nr:hypothetical protein [Elusimicrobiaceae bacterium]